MGEWLCFIPKSILKYIERHVIKKRKGKKYIYL